MTDPVGKNSINKTVAGEIAKKLDSLDSSKDKKIDISVWNKFWANNADYGTAGTPEKEALNGKAKNDTITLQQATDLIMARLFNKFTKADEVDKKGAELLKKGEFELKDSTDQEITVKAATVETSTEDQKVEGVTFKNKGTGKDDVYKEKEGDRLYIKGQDGNKNYLIGYDDANGNKLYITESEFNEQKEEAIGQKNLPEGVTAELNEKGEVVFKQNGNIISAEEVKEMIKPKDNGDGALNIVAEKKEEEQEVVSYASLEKAHHDIQKYTKTRKLGANDKVTEYYKYDVKENGKKITVHSRIVDGKEKKLIVLSNSGFTNKKFATMEEVKEAFGAEAKDLPENFELPSGIEGTYDNNGKLVFYNAMSGKQVSAEDVAKEIKSTAAKNALKAEAKANKQKAVKTAKQYYQNNARDGVVEVSERVVNGDKQYYAVYTDKTSGKIVRKTLDKKQEELVTIKGGGVGFQGKRELVTRSELIKAAKEAGIQNAENLTDVPKGYKCIWDSDNGIKLIQKGADEKKADEK